MIDPAELLGLPERARLSERLTKAMLREQIGLPDGKIVDRVVASARVVGILRPETVQVPAHPGPGDPVSDIPVLHVVAASSVSAADRRRLVELVQRAMPRPVVLVVDGPDVPAELSLALTHVSRTDPGRRTSVVDTAVTVAVADLPDGVLDIAGRDRTDLRALYRDLVRVTAAGGRPVSASLGAEEAVELRRQLTVMDADLAAVVREAKRAPSQQARITANNAARALRQRIATVRSALFRSDPAQHDTGTSRSTTPGETIT